MSDFGKIRREDAVFALDWIADIACGRRSILEGERQRLVAAIFLVKVVLLEAGKDERS